MRGLFVADSSERRGTKSWLRWLLLTMVLSGILLRLREYLLVPVLGHDEAALANNIVDYSLFHLLTNPLDYGQVAPIGLLAANKVLALLLGTSELVLRLLPFASSLGSVVMAVLIAQRVFTTQTARLTFVGSIAFAEVLIYYASEAKQYAVDVFVTLVVLWVAISYARWRRGLVWLSLTGATAVWFSQASVFMVAGIGLALGWGWLRERRWRTLTTVGLTWVGSTGLMLLATPRAERTLEFMRLYWDSAFAPFPPMSQVEFLWYPATAAHLVSFSWRETLFISDHFVARLVLLALTVAGGVVLISLRRNLALVVLIPACLLIAVSALRLYPVRHRLVLFLVPIVFLLCALVLDWLSLRAPPGVHLFAALFGLVLVASLLIGAVRVLAEPDRSAGIRESLTYLAERWRPGDTLTINEESIHAYRYYANRRSAENFGDPSLIAQPLDVGCLLSRENFANRGWFLFSHEMRNVPSFVADLAAHAPLIESSENRHASLYLFDFSAFPDDSRFHCQSNQL